MLLVSFIFFFYIHHFIHVFSILLDGLIVGVAIFHIGHIANLHFFAALRQVFYHRTGSGRHHSVAFVIFFIEVAAVVIAVGGFVDHDLFRTFRQGRNGCPYPCLHHRIVVAREAGTPSAGPARVALG